jgi:predicted acetyltransferase
MPYLVAPTPRVRASYLDAVKEFAAERGAGKAETVPDDRDGFASYATRIRGEAFEDAPRTEGTVPSTTLWFVDGETYLGRLSIRHRFTPWLLEYGGHIGYEVRPSARRRGHATAMLRAGLPVAAGLGIDPAHVTCDTGNVASRKVIEACHGVFEDRRGGKLRYWVPTRSAVDGSPAGVAAGRTEGCGA